MKNNNKNVTKRKVTFKLVFFAALAVIGGIPIIIVIIYSKDKIPSSVDMLMYFGTTASGFATLVAVFIAFDKEKDHREEEKRHDARVFIVMDSNIKHPDFNDFCNYSRNSNISKLYYFRNWLSEEDAELWWITKSDNKDLTQRCRFASFIVANPTDKPIYDVCISVDVDVVPVDNSKMVEGQSTLKAYEPIEFTVLPQQSKIAFVLPLFKEKQYIARCVKITYLTQMKEQMRYECEYSLDELTVMEKYYVNDEELFCANKKISVFFDLNHWMES